ncbi:MAG: DUF4405 domain-containing protein [Methanospirillum sp.]|uniref:DUF4405 domain-containing protein n=1 Tax=Methanospirillum sp. TaxID=45200 RepID=UPI00237088DE|nr:DUF4405 domain-containing protein [Methanospirillum sp.]MDD1729081.1 DUF4405 domain-containing protein [Methanospirillum sp.]
MKRVLINYLVDIGLLITALICCITGLLKWKELQSILGIAGPGPSAMGRGNFSELAQNGGMHGPDGIMSLLTPVHEWAGVVVILLALIHLILHRKWLAEMTRNLLSGKI